MAEIEEIPTEHPSETVARAYSGEFLRQLGAQFDFEADNPDCALNLRRIGQLYLATFRAQQSEKEFAPRNRKQFQNLQNLTVRLREQLEELDSDIPLILQSAEWVNRGNSNSPNFDASSKPANRDLSGELFRQLQLLESGLEMFLARLAPRAGRKIDEGLALLVRRAANFWTGELKREFTLDYQEGSGTTQAFLFVQSLLSPIADIPDTAIVTAMRREIASRNNIARGERP